ncbi:MAG: hypothetical protein JW982_05960 [Spirochaetes bacterium]|nr:hypothetical protein [Spirochaetota bacterium]
MESVRYFVKGLFRGIPETEKITEQREELERHINDRLADYMDSGIPEKEAFSRVVESLGNLDELIDVITGEWVKIYLKKRDWFMMAGGIVYGTLYMVAVGIWFYFHAVGIYAVYIAVLGWLGFIVPALIGYIKYRNQPLATAVVPADISSSVRLSVFGWAGISLACWIVNILLINSGTFLSVVWAWMPTFGILTWPLMTAAADWMTKNLKVLFPDAE